MDISVWDTPSSGDGSRHMPAYDILLPNRYHIAHEKIERNGRREFVCDKENDGGHHIAHLYLHASCEVVFETLRGIFLLWRERRERHPRLKKLCYPCKKRERQVSRGDVYHAEENHVHRFRHRHKRVEQGGIDVRKRHSAAARHRKIQRKDEWKLDEGEKNTRERVDARTFVRVHRFARDFLAVAVMLFFQERELGLECAHRILRFCGSQGEGEKDEFDE